jgi:hypothetical protein
MPTVIKPDPDLQSGTNGDSTCSSPWSLLYITSPDHRHHHSSILRSSFSSTDPPSIAASNNGFAHTVIRAWQQDLHLRLRPDDIWLAILTQFSCFVNGNGNAEALRSIFVAHEGQQELAVDVDGTIKSVDFGAIAQQLAAKAKERLVDPNIADTLLPTFTTTTPHDQAVAAMAFLGVTKPYFGRRVKFGCGFPSVTLLGERSDWANILERIAWFGTLGHEETDAWTIRLTKVLEYMVASFDTPDMADIKEFWARAVHETKSSMSGGIVTLSGWLTAFCWWGADGKRVQSYTDEELRCKFVAGYRRLTLDGVGFPIIRRTELPPGVVTVPVTLDNGEITKAEFVAGSMGMRVIDREGQTAAQPASGWWLLSAPPKKDAPVHRPIPTRGSHLPRTQHYSPLTRRLDSRGVPMSLSASGETDKSDGEFAGKIVSHS